MGLDFFENSMESGMIQSPNDYYRDLTQAFINDQWDNTSAKYTILQQRLDCQDKPLEDCFEPIEAWMNYVVGQGTSMRNGDDFVQLTFKNIDHKTVRGQYFQFENNYWILTFGDEHSGLSHSVVVRRCNNILKVVDPQNGWVFCAPCVIDYDMSSPSSQVSRYIITPNNHATVIVQGNKDTLRLFKTNTRFLLGGRPFKLTGYQNALYNKLLDDETTILYLDMYLDEIHDKDDLENGVADNGEYNYQIQINAQYMNLLEESQGQLSAIAQLNGAEVKREIYWQSSDTKVVKIDSEGKYQVVGKAGQSAIIYASLNGNPNVTDYIQFEIVDKQDITPEVYLSPSFENIREYQDISFNVCVSYDGKDYVIDNAIASLNENEVVVNSEYLGIEKMESSWKLSCFKRNKDLQMLYVTIPEQQFGKVVKAKFAINAVSMMG